MSNSSQGPLNPLGTLWQRMEVVQNFLRADETAVICQAMPEVTGALVVQGVPKADIPQAPAPTDSYEDGRRVVEAVERLAKQQFTRTFRSLIALPRLERDQAIANEDLTAPRLRELIYSRVVERDLVTRLLNAAYNIYDYHAYASPLMREMQELHWALEEIPVEYWWDAVYEVLAEAHSEYSTEELWNSFFTDLNIDRLEKGDTDYFESILNFGRQHIRFGVEKRVLLETIEGTARYSKEDLDKLHEWKFLSDEVHATLVRWVQNESPSFQDC